MSEISDRSRLEFVLLMIDDIDFIVKRHVSITNALQDREGCPAILMCLMQIGEKLNKVSAPAFLKQLPISEAASVRNIIAHNYDGVNIGIIEEIIVYDLPDLRRNINIILDNETI